MTTDKSPYTKSKHTATLLDCTLRFRGEYNWTEIEKFIEYVRAYKNWKNISDEQCAAEFPHLLDGHAYAWYQLRANNFEHMDFDTMLDVVRSHFMSRRKPHELYMNLYKPFNEESEQSILHFMMMKLEIFAQLPLPEPADSVKIDMLYGLLPQKVRSEMPRCELYDVQEFINRLKYVCESNGSSSPPNRGYGGCDLANSTDLQSPLTPRAFQKKRFRVDFENAAHTNASNAKHALCAEQDEIIELECSSPDECGVNASRQHFASVRISENFIPQSKAGCETFTEIGIDPASKKKETTRMQSSVGFQIDSDIMEEIDDIINDIGENEDDIRDPAQAALQQTKPKPNEAKQQSKQSISQHPIEKKAKHKEAIPSPPMTNKKPFSRFQCEQTRNNPKPRVSHVGSPVNGEDASSKAAERKHISSKEQLGPSSHASRHSSQDSNNFKRQHSNSSRTHR